MLLKQLTMDLPVEDPGTFTDAVHAAIAELSLSSKIESRGAIFTRREVVDFLLDLAGYTVDQLHQKRVLESAFGGGDFLLPIITRLLCAWKYSKSGKPALQDLGDTIRAVELHQDTFRSTYTAVIALLESEELDAKTATALADRWLSQGDFLLTTLDGQFDFVVGNPPYVRQELIPPPLY